MVFFSDRLSGALDGTGFILRVGASSKDCAAAPNSGTVSTLDRSAAGRLIPIPSRVFAI
jgi:hypothetical protein